VISGETSIYGHFGTITITKVLTLKYGEKFDLDRFEMIEDISYCKVINYGEQKADVIYVCEGRISILVTYQKL